uniref:BolA-like protein n=1 Tax=Tetranychus urticae TaxID=32264 RepID=T1K011_TETUR
MNIVLPIHCLVVNESNQHNVPRGSETHFRVLIVSNKFDSTSLIERHRHINEILNDELKSGVHALAIEAFTPVEWEKSNQQINQSPKCRGGSNR